MTIYQIQFGMYVTGAKDAYLVLYNPDVYPQSQQLIVKHIQKDSGIQTSLKTDLNTMNQAVKPSNKNIGIIVVYQHLAHR